MLLTVASCRPNAAQANSAELPRYSSCNKYNPPRPAITDGTGVSDAVVVVVVAVRTMVVRDCVVSVLVTTLVRVSEIVKLRVVVMVCETVCTVVS